MTDHAAHRLQNFGKIAFVRSAAEAGGFTVFFGSTVLTESLMPKQIDWLKDYLATHFVKYHLAAADSIADKMKAVEGSERTEARKMMTPEQKARYYANYIIDYGIRAPFAFVTQMALQGYLMKKMGLPLSNTKSFLTLAVDEAPKFGAIYFFNTQIPEKVDHIQQGISRILQTSTGMSKERADTYSVDTMNIVVPNALGLASSISYLYWDTIGKHRPAQIIHA